MTLRLMYLASRLLWAITPTHQRQIMRLIPAYRRRDDDLTERLIEGYLWSSSLTNAGTTYSSQASTSVPGRMTFTTLEKNSA